MEGLTMVVETAISTTQKKFGHRYRIELYLFLQLAGCTASRPQAILSLMYRHLVGFQLGNLGRFQAKLLRDQASPRH
jgi:hypothetical protein